ncbi:MAG: CvpA family protein [Aminivibrio sp.]|jgi:membrane protein required for colicin V production
MTFSYIFDIAIALVVATFAARGMLRGLSGEFFSLLGMVGGAVVAWKYSGAAAGWIAGWFGGANPSMVSFGAMAVIYIGAVLLAGALCRVVKAFIKFASLAFTDRLLGAGAGLLKGAVLILFLYVGLATYSPFIPTGWMAESYVMRGADRAWPPVREFLTERGLFPENFTVPELNLPPIFEGDAGAGDGS